MTRAQSPLMTARPPPRPPSSWLLWSYQNSGAISLQAYILSDYETGPYTHYRQPQLNLATGHSWRAPSQRAWSTGIWWDHLQTPSQWATINCSSATNWSQAAQLLCIEDSLSGRSFLVNTGAAFSLFSHYLTDKLEDLLLTAPDGTPIKLWGIWALPLCFRKWRFIWDLVLASVDHPILASDFLWHHDLWYTCVLLVLNPGYL